MDVVAADDRAARVLWNADGRIMRVRAPEDWTGDLGADEVPPALSVEDGWADLSLAVGSVSRRSPEAARHVLRELWRVTRPAGRMVVIDDFVRGGPPGSRTPLDINQFFHVLAEATGMGVALHSITSFRAQGDDIRRGAAVVAVRIGGRAR